MANHNSSRETKNHRWKRDATVAGTTGAITAIIMGLASFLLGSVSGWEARALLEAIQPTTRFLCSAVMTAAATILALMLTLLSLTLNADQELDAVFYRRIKQIAFYNMLLLVASTCFLVVHCIPITESDEIDTWWYQTVYHFTMGFAAILGGGLVCVVVMLYTAISDIISAFCLDDPNVDADECDSSTVKKDS